MAHPERERRDRLRKIAHPRDPQEMKTPTPSPQQIEGPFRDSNWGTLGDSDRAGSFLAENALSPTTTSSQIPQESPPSLVSIRHH